MKSYIIVLALILGAFSSVFGQQQQIFGFHFRNKFIKKEKIPFGLYSNLIIIKVSIDDSEPLNFILDTGVSNIIISDPKVGEKLNLKYSRQISVAGMGNGEKLKANISVDHNVKIGRIVSQHKNLIVVERDVLQLSEYVGIPIHGIFGHTLFEKFVIELNYTDRYLTFHSPVKFKFKNKFGTKYPINVSSSKPFIDSVLVATNSGPLKPLQLLIDTGAGHAILINPEGLKKINPPKQTFETNLGIGLNGEIYGYIGRLSEFKLGDFQFENVLCSFPEYNSISDKANIRRSDGSLGGELLRRFNLVFNFKEGYLAMKEIKSKQNEPFEHDMSGLTVIGKGEHYEDYFVSEVIPGSPADEAGLEPDDEFVLLNGKNVSQMNLSEINKILSNKDGDKITTFIKRNGRLRFFEFELKRVI